MRATDERGAAGGAEVVAFAVAVFASGSLLMANAWAVIDAKAAVDHAAREAGRAYVEAPTPEVAPDDARAAARTAFAGTGRDPDALELRSNDPTFHRCAVVVHRAEYQVAAGRIPFVDVGGPITVIGTHRERLDRFGSTTDGDADCG